MRRPRLQGFGFDLLTRRLSPHIMILQLCGEPGVVGQSGVSRPARSTAVRHQTKGFGLGAAERTANEYVPGSTREGLLERSSRGQRG